MQLRFSPVHVATLGSLLALSSASAQAPVSLGPTGPFGDGMGCRLEPHVGRLRAEGCHYRADFAASGMSFTPGRGAERAPALHLATVSIGRAGRARAVAASALPTAGDGVELAVCYPRGHDVVERWRVQPAGVELTYTFSTPLPGRGDLVVRLAADTDLVAVPSGTAGGGLVLRPASGDGTPGVRIGAVTGIDAAGRTCRGAVLVDGRHLELRLPAEFVDRAAWPLVLDPLIGSEFAVDPVGDQATPAVAYEATSSRYLVAWHQQIDLNNSQVVGRMVDAQGTPIGGTILIRYNPGRHARQPAVASVRASGRFLVTWHEAATVLGPWTVACRCVNPDGTMSATVTLFSTTTGTLGPVLGSNATASDSRVLMVYGSPGSIVARGIAVPAGSGPPAVGGLVTVASGGLGNKDFLVTSGCGAVGRFVVWWRHDDLAPSSWRARAVGPAGNLLGTELDLGVPPAGAGARAVDGDGTDFLLGWVRNGDVSCRKLRWNGSDLVAVGSDTQVTATPSGKVDLTIALLGPKILLTWSDDGAAPLANDVHGIALEPGTCRACDLPFAIPRPARFDFEPRVAAQYATSPAAGDQALIVFTSAQLAPPFDAEIVAQRFAAIGAGGPLANLGGGCGRRTAMSANGPIAIANPGLAFRLDGVAGAAAVYFGLAVAGGAPLACGTCQITAPAAVVPGVLGRDRAELPLGIGCDPALVGAALGLQGWVVGTSEAPCALVPQLSFSDRYVATIGQ